MATVEEEKEPEPVELNSFEFFVQALSHFEVEARGKLSSEEQSPASQTSVNTGEPLQLEETSG